MDDRRVLSGIISLNRNGLRWCDTAAEYGPPRALYNRWKRWSGMGVFARIMLGLAEQTPDNKTISIDATCQRRRNNLPLGRSKSRPLGYAPWGVMPSSSKHVPRRVGRQANLMIC